jgi:hypothetical protein
MWKKAGDQAGWPADQSSSLKEVTIAGAQTPVLDTLVSKNTGRACLQLSWRVEKGKEQTISVSTKFYPWFFFRISNAFFTLHWGGSLWSVFWSLC